MPEPASGQNNEAKTYPKGHWVNVVTMLAVLVYTGVQICQTYLIRQNNIASQRAFVFSQPTVLQIGINPEKIPALGVFISLENSGSTPTKDLTSKIVCEPSIASPIEPWDFLKQHKIETTPVFIGARARSTVQCSFTMEQIKQMGVGMLHGYVLGEIVYYDRIDPSLLHKTHYAYELFRPIINQPNNTVETALVTVGKHNCADEECPN
jgi:hypothetical protein